MPEQPRVPGGLGGGQFDRTHHAAADDVELPEDTTSGGEMRDARHSTDSTEPGEHLAGRLMQARHGDHSALNTALRDASPLVRAEATVNPQLSRRQHARLARDRDINVRLAAACRPMFGGADLAARDTSPLVRIRALTGTGLSDAAFAQLDQDSEVQRILASISR